jgi:DNA-binding protein YbaB
VSGKFEATSVKIDPEAFDPQDISELEAMVLAAAKDAFNKASTAQQKMLSSATGGMRIPGMF